MAAIELDGWKIQQKNIEKNPFGIISKEFNGVEFSFEIQLPEGLIATAKEPNPEIKNYILNQLEKGSPNTSFKIRVNGYNTKIGKLNLSKKDNNQSKYKLLYDTIDTGTGRIDLGELNDIHTELLREDIDTKLRPKDELLAAIDGDLGEFLDSLPTEEDAKKIYKTEVKAGIKNPRKLISREFFEAIFSDGYHLTSTQRQTIWKTYSLFPKGKIFEESRGVLDQLLNSIEGVLDEYNYAKRAIAAGYIPESLNQNVVITDDGKVYLRANTSVDGSGDFILRNQQGKIIAYDNAKNDKLKRTLSNLTWFSNTLAGENQALLFNGFNPDDIDIEKSKETKMIMFKEGTTQKPYPLRRNSEGVITPAKIDQKLVASGVLDSEGNRVVNYTYAKTVVELDKNGNIIRERVRLTPGISPANYDGAAIANRCSNAYPHSSGTKMW
jgi:hypothetical protein